MVWEESQVRSYVRCFKTGEVARKLNFAKACSFALCPRVWFYCASHSHSRPHDRDTHAKMQCAALLEPAGRGRKGGPQHLRRRAAVGLEAGIGHGAREDDVAVVREGRRARVVQPERLRRRRLVLDRPLCHRRPRLTRQSPACQRGVEENREVAAAACRRCSSTNRRFAGAHT